MKTLQEISAALDAAHPVLTEVIKGMEVELSPAARADTLAQWAQGELEKQEALAAEAALAALAAEAALAASGRKTWPNVAAFLTAFTMPELAGISLSTDPTLAALRILLLSHPDEVWSDDPRILAGLDALVAAGVITKARRAEIVAR